MAHLVRATDHMRWRTIVIIAVGALAVFLVALASVVPFSSDAARAKVIAVLADRLDSEVQLDSLQLRVLPRLRAEGRGLTIRHRGRRDVPPLITVREFSVEGGIGNLLRKHISVVTLDGLDIQIPPPGPDGDAGGHALPPGPAYVIDQLTTTDARLTVIPAKANKNPRVWAIHDLRMQSVSFDSAMPFDATITNAVPPGEIATRGTFGPWRREEPGLTSLDGTFTFEQADLSVFKGIAGVLSAAGGFKGRLDRIEVNGDTETPEFMLASIGHALPLKAKYQTVVDGLNGDTILERIEATLGTTPLVARGSVIDDNPGEPGRRVAVDVTIDKGRLDDLLWLAVKAPKPPMTGEMTLSTSLEIPPGPQDVVEKLRLAGTFSLTDARFTDLDIQKKIEELSRRSRGQVEAQRVERVTSDFKGSFKLADAVLTIPSVAFDVPGSAVRLSGTYGMSTEAINFRGTLFMDAKVSETVTGFKSLLLKVVDPLFRGKNGGSAIPIQVSGRRSSPSFGIDKGRIFKK